jgi:hypothetical protein
MSASNESRQLLLRIALFGNAAFSTLSGLIILFAGRWVSGILGLPREYSLFILGIALLVFGLLLISNASRKMIKLSDAWIAVLLDIAWVVGSYALLFIVPFSNSGKLLVIAVAELVFVFAILQWLGIRRIKKSAQLA